MISLAFDLILGVALLASAWVTFHTANLSRAVIWFVAFGLTLALIWVRLDVLVVALAEASVGAVLTGIMINRIVLDLTPTPACPHHSLVRALTGSSVLLLLLLSVVFLRPDNAASWHQLFIERQLWFALIAVLVITLSIFIFLRHAHLLKRLFALNLMGSGVFLFMISMAQHLREPSPASQALVLAGMFISVSATALALHIFRRYYAVSQQVTLPQERS